MVHPICKGLSKQNIIRSSRFPRRTGQTSLPKSRGSDPGLEDRPLLLENPDNKLCYLNSAMNILYMVKEVREYISTLSEEKNAVLKEIHKIFFKTQKNAGKLAELLKMGEGAQSCHEVIKKVIQLLPLPLQASMSLSYRKLHCCKRCGESATPPRSVTQIEVLLPEEGCLGLLELLNQDQKGTCGRCNHPIDIFNDYEALPTTKTIFLSVLQADPMPIKDFDPDKIYNFFGARWTLKGAIIYLPDNDPKVDYGENGHSISWTKHLGKWCMVNDEEMEVYDSFDASKADVEMMVFERIEKRN